MSTTPEAAGSVHPEVARRDWGWLRSWESLMAIILVIVVGFNLANSPYFLGVGNLVNLFEVRIEKVIIALVMTFVIVNGEIDLSVASIMGLSGCVAGWLTSKGLPFPASLLVALAAGGLAGAFNGFWVAYVGLPSLAVTLAGLIGYRGIARLLLEDRSLTNIPDWYSRLGTQPFLGPLTLAILIFFVGFVLAAIVLHFTAFGRYVYVIGNNKDAARFSGVQVRRVKMSVFTASGLVAGLAGLLYIARLGAVQADMAQGFELDIITMVLLGGVSIFGGTGTMLGVGLSILVVLSLRNGMDLTGVTGNTQTSIIGGVLILSVLIPNLAREAQAFWKRRTAVPHPKEKPVSQEGAL